jgi:hypothetical protein
MLRAAAAVSLLVSFSAAKTYNVLVVGDSWGVDLWPAIQHTFDSHNVSAKVFSTAIGGTTACQWAAKFDGTALVKSAKSKFPDLADGPDFVWYSLGGNDLALDKPYHQCMKGAVSYDDAKVCVGKLIEKINGCTSTLLETYWAKYPKSKVFQCGYDMPCLDSGYNEGKCMTVAKQRTPYCGSNVTCHTNALVDWQQMEIGSRQQKYPQPQYTGLNILGTVQKAAGVPGADVGKPVLDQGARCDWEFGCVHPKPKTPAWYAVGEAFWDLFFSKHVHAVETVV